MTRYLLIPIAVLALALTFAACGDDDGDESADLDRYCAIVTELDTLGAEEFEELEADPDATQDDFEQLQSDLIEDNEELFDEVEEVAPEEIRDDVEVLVSAVQARAAGEEQEYSDEEINDAESAVESFEEENCGDDEATTTTTGETTETEDTTTTETDETTTTETEDDSDETTTEDSGGVSPE